MNLIKMLGLGLTVAAALAAPSGAAAQEPGGPTRPAPQAGSTCEGERACEEAARQCRGTVVQVVVRNAAGAPTLLGWCQSKKSPRLKCSGESNCEELEKICLAAKGSYKETVDPDDGHVSGTCTLPQPPTTPRDKKKVDIWCEGVFDCTWLATYCISAGGGFHSETDAEGVFGACVYTPRSRR